MQDTVDLLSKLIPLRPVSADVQAVNTVTECLQDYLEGEGLHCRLEEVGERNVLFASTEQTKCPEILFNVHVDVVPGENDQFEPLRKDGWLHGRGASDCLGNAVMCAHVLCRARDHASVGVIFSADEEIGGKTTAVMVERGYAAKRLILVVDGAAYAVAVAQKGVLTCSLTATGVSAHSSTPWLGKNAIHVLIDNYLKIRALFPEVKEGDEWHDTMAATIVNGGTAANRIPDEATMTLNIRYTEEGGDQRWIERIKDVADVDVDVQMACPVIVFDENTPEFQQLAEAMATAFDRNIEMVRMNGATDARHFAKVGVPVAILGTPGRDIHGRDEAVDIDGLKAYEEMLTDYVTRIGDTHDASH